MKKTIKHIEESTLFTVGKDAIAHVLELDLVTGDMLVRFRRVRTRQIPITITVRPTGG